MNKRYPFIVLVCALAVFASPAGVSAQASGPVQVSGSSLGSALSNLSSGMTDATARANCKDVRGALSTSVGLVAVQNSGVVPVSDAAVTRNTGILVYKECVLRAMVDAERKNEIAQLVDNSTKSFLTKRCNVDVDGEDVCTVSSQSGSGPMFPENLAVDELKWSDLVVDKAINGAALDAITSAYKDDVKLAINRTYAQATRNPGSSLACSNSDPAAVIAINNGSYSGPQDLYTVADPNCNAMGAYFAGQGMVMSGVAANQENMLTRLGWNRGVYDIAVTNSYGVSRVVTPGFILAGALQQQLGSGFRQLENANDIGQQIDVLFAGIGNKLIADGVYGLQGLINSAGGQSSYLGQIVSSTGAEVQSGQVNATIDAVLAMRQNEIAYVGAKKATADLITGYIAQLRGAENQCWSQFVVPAVTTYAQQNNIPRLTMATSTERFAQKVIDQNITAILNQVNNDITASNATMTQINQVLTGVTNGTTNPTDAYNQINTILTSGARTADQAAAAIQQTTAVQTALTGVVNDNLTKWGNDPNPNVGWCNINNPAVIKMWADKWNR